MLRRVIKPFVILVALALAFFTGAYTAIKNHWGSQVAGIDVRNETTLEIRSVMVTYTTCSLTRQLLHQVSAQPTSRAYDREISMKIVLCGEGSQTTEVTFNDGRILRSKGSYIEGGYEITERILLSGIVSEYTRTFP